MAQKENRTISQFKSAMVGGGAAPIYLRLR